MSSCLLLVGTACLYAQSGAQTAGPAAVQSSDSAPPAFRADVQNVVVDVVVNDRSGSPRKGLHKEDFGVQEQGRPQRITSFEEHDGTPGAAVLTEKPATPGLFTNEPAAPVSDTVNVLLLDSLNTEILDQSYVHSQATKYLKSLPPGTRMAIFTLGSELRFVLGFTSDGSKLSAALNSKAATPQSSNLMTSETESEANATQADQIQQYANDTAQGGHPPDPSVVAALHALQGFQEQNEGAKDLDRQALTLQALQNLARYLAAVPGRKNVMWFAGSLPPMILGGQSEDLDLSDQIRNTVNTLAAARVALYPVRASGIPANSMFDAGIRAVGMNGAQSAQDYQTQSLRKDSSIRAATEGEMGELADETGGEAIYGTNDLSQAMGKAISNGRHYYTLTYSPTDKSLDGAYRPIRVKVLRGRYVLQYRRGYFAASPKSIRKAAQDRATQDPLVPLMNPGLPALTQILFKVRVQQADPHPPTTLASSTEKRPLDSKRYTADFAISMHDVDLELTPDGKHSGSLELMLVAYDRTGNALNFAVHSVQLALTPEHYLAFQEPGLQLHDELDVPRAAVNLRIGVFDPDSNKAGTIEVPLNQVTTAVTHARVVQ